MVECTTEDGRLICSFPERLDTANCAEYREVLLQKIQESTMPVVFDLQKTKALQDRDRTNL